MYKIKSDKFKYYIINGKKYKIAKKNNCWLILSIFVLVITIAFFAFFILRPKFQDVTIELGTKKIDANKFVVSKFYRKKTELITDISKLDLTKVKSYDVILSYDGKKQTVKLNIVDTTKPEVKYKNVVSYLAYEFKPEDFVESVSDYSDYEIKSSSVININEYNDYIVNIKVIDKYGNEISKDCKLTIAWIYPTVTYEIGDKFDKSNVVINIEADKDKLSAEELKKVDINTPGKYTITSVYNGITEKSVITVQDTKGPTLNVKNLSLIEGNTLSSYNKFVESYFDASGEVNIEFNGEIDYSKLGKQNLEIIATDKYDNKTKKTVTLTIKTDSNGPVFSGIKSLVVDKHSSINYKEGIKAVDAKDGEMKFNVDTSKVDLDEAGIYYAVYTSIDLEDNTTTVKRKITVNHDEEDTEKIFMDFYNKYLKGKTVLEITREIRSRVYYDHSYGEGDPIWYAINNRAGNCKVHALVLKKAFDTAGIENMIIHTIDETHYWNLVYLNGKWRHYDSTPGAHLIGPCTDDEKFYSSGLYQRQWNRSAYPVAN